MAYNPDFIGDGITVPLPVFSPKIAGAVVRNSALLRDDVYADYIHYSIVMNQQTKQLIYAASNINQNKFIQVDSKLSKDWGIDNRVGIENQLDNDDYFKNVWDKGHMVQRSNSNWGDSFAEVKMANDDTYWYTNAAFQHQNFNRDEWLALENHMGKEWIYDDNGMLCLFTGPVHLDFDRYYTRDFNNPIRIPSGFFKVIFYKSKTDQKLASKAFVMYQDEAAQKDQRGSRNMDFTTYQVPLTEITRLTGLVFDKTLYQSNPLFFNKNDDKAEELNIQTFPEKVAVTKPADLIDEGTPRQTQFDPASRHIAIAAMMVNPVGSDSAGEWISIINLTKDTVELEGWKLEDDLERVIELSGRITTGSVKKVRMADHGKIKLRNSGGAVKLLNKQNDLVDLFRYTKSQVKEGLAVAR